MGTGLWRRLAPATLRAQTLLVLTSIFIIAQVLSLLLFQISRDRTVVLAEANDLADRIIGIVELAERFPAEDRLDILAAAQTQLLSMYPSIVLPADERCRQNDIADRISTRLTDWFSNYDRLDASVCVSSLPEAYQQTQRLESEYDVIVYVDFPDGTQSTFHATLLAAPSLFQDAVLTSIGLVALTSLLLGWYLIHRALAPLSKLTRAADEIGVNIDASALREEGPHEVQVAARAFNRMQARLQKLVHGQTEMIAAISHDLRSAVTRIQLRVELLEDDHEREGLQRVVTDMRLMIQSVLDYVRGVEPTESRRTTDILALLESLCEDLAEEGYPVSLENITESRLLLCRPSALRRCFQNIIDNAVKYGGTASVSYHNQQDKVVIVVEDSGPGVAETELQNILQPFYRLERSRNREIAGAGLGLSIALNVVQLHGGQLLLTNRSEGGLRVEIHLPAVA